MKIRIVNESSDHTAIRMLFEAYARTLPSEISVANIRKEIETLPGQYTPPRGQLWLAENANGEPIGCIGLRPLEATIGEMKRLYVQPDYRKQGIGKQLIQTLLTAAPALGYDRIRLDSFPEMTSAIQLYQSLGFVPIEAYHSVPIPGLVYMEIDLTSMNPVKINLIEKFQLFQDHWSPKIIAELNGQQVKLVKFHGEFVWHHHDKEDELFLVVNGRFRMEFRDRHVWLETGEMIVVPHGVEHRPVAEDEVWVLLFEPASTLNTGNIQDAKTVQQLDRI